MEERNLPRIEAPIDVDRDSDDFQTFVRSAALLIESHIEANREEASTYTDVDKSLDDVLGDDNTRSIDVRARPLENPKVTLWLRDCPVWANDAWTETFHPWDLNRFNGKVTVTFDVRPF